MSAASAGGELRVICGPTAAGKSAIALWLAERHRLTIVSADSRQVYRGFDIGTAKPTRAERARVPHEGIDVADPAERYSAARWAEAAAGWIENAIAAGRTPVVVGGTGLYVRALCEGLFHEPAIDAQLRARLAVALEQLSTAELRRWVSVLDPARARFGRTQLLRAAEIALLTGRRVSTLHDVCGRKGGWRPRYLVVDPGPALPHRIESRIDDMLEHGWPQEVSRLLETTPADAPAWQASGYAAVRDLVTGTSGRAQVRERILIATRQYAKRQRTWFRHQLPANLLTVVDPNAADCDRVVARWFEERSASTEAVPA